MAEFKFCNPLQSHRVTFILISTESITLPQESISNRFSKMVDISSFDFFDAFLGFYFEFSLKHVIFTSFRIFKTAECLFLLI